MRARLIFHGAWSCQLGRTVLGGRMGGAVGELERVGRNEERVDGRTRKERMMRRV